MRKLFVLLCAGGIAAATGPFLTASPDICFTAGSATYRLSPNAPAADDRVAIDNHAAHPDMRVRLVDRVDTADFVLTDDAGTLTGNACKPAGPLKTIRIVPAGTPADVTVSVAGRPDHEPQDESHPGTHAGTDPGAHAGLALYVHSARVSHFDAAAPFAFVRHEGSRASAARPATWRRSAKI
jgi:hypothetical protein